MAIQASYHATEVLTPHSWEHLRCLLDQQRGVIPDRSTANTASNSDRGIKRSNS